MRLSGIARRTRDVAHPPDASDKLLERIIVSNKAGPLGRVENLAPFDLELGSGERVRVELAQHVRLEPVHIRDGKWGDFESEAAFAPLRATAPGPHIVVQVRQAEVKDGSQVEVLAQDDAEHVFETMNAGHRSAPTRKLVTVTARAIAAGPDAVGIIDRMVDFKEAAKDRRQAAKDERAKKAQAPKRSALQRDRANYAPSIVAALSLPFFLAAMAIKLTPLTVDLGMIGVMLVTASLVSWALAKIPRFVSDGRSVGGRSTEQPGRVVLFTVFFALGFMIFSLFADHAGPWQPPNTPPALVYNASHLSAVGLGIWSLLVAGIAIARGRAEARLCRVLLGAPPLPASGALHRTWGSFEGVVRDPTPVTAEGEAVALVHVISEEVVEGSDPNIFTERVLSKGTFFVDAPNDGDDGAAPRRSVEIHPDGAVWTSNVAVSVPRKTKGRPVVEHIRAVPLRGNILVAGRVDRDERALVGRVASGGAESLLFMAVRQGESPRRQAHAMLALRRVAVLIALGGLAVAVGTLLFVEPRLPKFHVPSEGGD